MKIAIYSPYLPKHFGGGEKYLFDTAQVLAQKHQVFVAISQESALSQQAIKNIGQQYSQFLNSNLDKLNFINTPLGTSASFLKKLFWTKQFDCLYYQTDGSLFFSLAKKNILHIQIPFLQSKNSFLERLKLHNWQVKNSNSYFTKKIVEQAWRCKIDFVHWPMVKLANSTQKIDLTKKQPIILSVGRFFTHLHCKRQDVLVEAFIKLCLQNPALAKKWQLVLVGNVEDSAYAKKVATMAKNWPIKIYHHLNHAKLADYYQLASIYWHASGFGVDEKQHPEKVEHFGISTAEAMLAGAVPVVINKGGQKEILGKDLANLLWNNQAELITKTVALINDQSKRLDLAKLAWQTAQQFSQERFTQTLWQMLE